MVYEPGIVVHSVWIEGEAGVHIIGQALSKLREVNRATYLFEQAIKQHERQGRE